MVKMYVKRLLVSLLVVCMLFALLTACNSKKKNDEVKNDEVTSIAESTAKSSGYAPIKNKKYNISWLTVAAFPIDENGEIIKYFEEKLNFDIDILFVEQANWQELINLKFASNEIPDVFGAMDMPSYYSYVKQGIAIEIPDEALKTYAPDIYKTYMDENPDAFKYSKINGKLYGLASYRSHSKYRNPIVWRGDWLKNVGIDKVPETLEELEKAFYKFTKEDPDKNGKNDTYALSKSGLSSIFGAFGYVGDIYPDYWALNDGKLVNGIVQPESKAALQLLSKWYKDGVLDPEFISGENKGGYWAISHAFINGRIGFTSHGYYYHWKKPLYEGDTNGNQYNYTEMSKVSKEAAVLIEYGMPPIGPDGKMGIAQESPISPPRCIGKPVQNEPDKMGKILEIFNAVYASEEDYLVASRGFEGKHWTLKNGTVEATEKFKDLKELTRIGGNGLFPFIDSYKFAPKLYGNWVEFGDKYNLNKGGIRNVVVSTLPSGGKYLAELKKIYEEAYISIITGDKPIEYFDEFIQKWLKAGGEQLTKEANDWYVAIK